MADDFFTRAHLPVACYGAPIDRQMAPVLAVGLDSGLSGRSARAVIEQIRRGELPAEHYARHVLDRCEARKALNTLISIDPAQVLRAAREADLLRRGGAPLGRLHGLPVPVKDSINTARLPTTSGTGALRNFVPDSDAPIIRQLTAQGGIVLGKTNLMEMSLGWTSNNKHFGAVRNPYDVSRIPGGSSGGSAAAVAGGIVPLAIGEDTLGSIRVPAALCGVCGLRPTVGRYPSAGVMPITPRWDAPGPLGRQVDDLVLFDQAMTGRDAPLRAAPLAGTRIAVPPEYLLGLDPEVERVFEAAMERLEKAGATRVRAFLPEVLQGARKVVAAIQSFEIVAHQSRYLQESGSTVRMDEMIAGMSSVLQKRYHSDFLPGGAHAISEQTYEGLLTRLAQMRSAMRAYFAEHRITALATPPTLSAATPIGDDVDTDLLGTRVPLYEVMARNVGHGSAVGMPCLVIPAGLSRANLPVGVSFDMLPGQDEQLLALGLSLEQLLGRIPPPPDSPAE